MGNNRDVPSGGCDLLGTSTQPEGTRSSAGGGTARRCARTPTLVAARAGSRWLLLAGAGLEAAVSPRSSPPLLGAAAR